MSDAINLLVHVAPDGPPTRIPVGGTTGAWQGSPSPRIPPTGAHVSGMAILPTHGAVWHVFSPADTDTLRKVLPTLLPPGALLPSSFLLDASVYLDARLLHNLEAVSGVRPYVILQGVGDAVLLPAGCAHQVCNIRSCVKVRA
eukprot:scaffold3816_cov135-Isochrysis_galbana.AAC.1